MNKNFLSVERFLNQTGLSKERFDKEWKNIPGVSFVNGEYLIFDETKWPKYNLRRNKLIEAGDKRYVLFKAINEYRYIDAIMLKASDREFESLLNDLLKIDYIEPNGSNNPYGANGYRVTLEGSNYIEEHKHKWILFVNKLLAEHTSEFLHKMATGG